MPEQIHTTFEPCYGFNTRIYKAPPNTSAQCGANPETVLNRDAIRRGMTGKLSRGLITKLLESQKWTCIVCNKDLRLGYHTDHIIPVSKGGQNVDDNIQILCPKCNLNKGNKDFAEFLKDCGLDPSNNQGLYNPSGVNPLEEA